MNVGYSVSKLKAMIESNNKGNRAYALDKSDIREFTKVTDAIRQVKYAGAVMYRGKIHLLGGDSYATRHEVYNPDTDTWADSVTLPTYFGQGMSVVYNDEIHILNSANATSYYKIHYKFDGEKWTKLSDTPQGLIHGSAVVYEGKLHIIGGGDNNAKLHYTWNEDTDTWTRLNDLPLDANYCTAFVLTNEIHLIWSKSHYKWNKDTDSWTNVDSGLTASLNDYWGVCVYNDVAYAVLSNTSALTIRQYLPDKNLWGGVSGDTAIVRCYKPNMVVCNNDIYIFTANNTKEVYRYRIRTKLVGEVDKNTFIYSPNKLNVIQGELQDVEKGYIATEDTSVVIYEK